VGRLPAYSALVACAAFEFVLKRALAGGASPRSRGLRTACELLLALLVMLLSALLLSGCFLAAGPKALG
jgi:hypothetical protein